MNGIPETTDHESYRIPQPDGTQQVLVRTLSQQQVKRMIQSAIDVVEELDPPEDLRLTVFAHALNLTGQLQARQSNIVPVSTILDNGKG